MDALDWHISAPLADITDAESKLPRTARFVVSDCTRHAHDAPLKFPTEYNRRTASRTYALSFRNVEIEWVISR